MTEAGTTETIVAMRDLLGDDVDDILENVEKVLQHLADERDVGPIGDAAVTGVQGYICGMAIRGAPGSGRDELDDYGKELVDVLSDPESWEAKSYVLIAVGCLSQDYADLYVLARAIIGPPPRRDQE